MIFSLSHTEKEITLPPLTDTDIICFFQVEHAVRADESLWWQTLTASLKGKRSVLILESNLSSFPSWDPSKRWLVGDDWCWLTPRSLSVISLAYASKSLSFQDFKTFLINYKP